MVCHAAAAITGPLCAVDSGFSLDAATVVARDKPRGKQALLRYVLRSPLAQQRLQLLADGMCRLTRGRAFSDGTFAIDLDPLSLLCRLAAAVPAPGFNTVRYGGVLASAAKMRPMVIPARAAPCDRPDPEGLLPPENNSNRPRRSGWRPWAELLKRSFDIELRCAHCNVAMTLKSFLTSRASLYRLLTMGPRKPAENPPSKSE